MSGVGVVGQRAKARITVEAPDVIVRVSCKDTGEVLEGPWAAVLNQMTAKYWLAGWTALTWEIERL